MLNGGDYRNWLVGRYRAACRHCPYCVSLQSTAKTPAGATKERTHRFRDAKTGRAFSGAPGEVRYYHADGHTYLEMQTGTSVDVEGVIRVNGIHTPEASWFVL